MNNNNNNGLKDAFAQFCHRTRLGGQFEQRSYIDISSYLLST